MQTNKKKVIFVGSFKSSTGDGGMGGQMFASRSLISAKELSDIEFIKIDTTAISIPAPSIYKRVPNVVKRILQYFYALIAHRVDACLIFSSVGLSFVEKGVMVLISSLFGVKIIFAPQSGLIIDSVNRSAMMKWFVSLIIRKADHVLCQSNSWKIYYQKLSGTFGEKFAVIQNWIDANQYSSTHFSPPIRTSGKLEIVYLGWLEPYKGVFDLLEAMLLLRDQVDFDLKIYGSGSVRDELQEKIDLNMLQEMITLEGWADFGTKVNAFRQADIFVLPSHREGLPNVLLEAMACRLPVIATDVGGIGDLIDDGKNGLLIKPHQPRELAQAVTKLSTNLALRQTLAINARKSILRNNTISTASNKLKMLF